MDWPMPRKPNYNFERHERERIKAEKKAEREKVKAERRAANRAANAAVQPDAPGTEEKLPAAPGTGTAKS